MSRLRAITARFATGRKRDRDEPSTHAAHEQHSPPPGPADIDNPAAASEAAPLAELEEHGAAPHEGDQSAVPDAASAGGPRDPRERDH